MANPRRTTALAWKDARPFSCSVGECKLMTHFGGHHDKIRFLGGILNVASPSSKGALPSQWPDIIAALASFHQARGESAAAKKYAERLRKLADN